MSRTAKPPKGPFSGQGARSPNREVATSAGEQDNPMPTRRAGKAAAVAGAEEARARGELVPLSPDTSAADGTPLAWAQSGDRLTTSQGLAVDDADNSLKVGPRGPSLLEDFHLRERITHFDHERIPERVVHARGAGAHGTFRVADGLEDLCQAEALTSVRSRADWRSTAQHITDPVEYDGVVLAAAPDAVSGAFVQEIFRHHKTIAGLDAAWLAELGIDGEAPGVTTTPGAFFAALADHRHWAR